MNQRLEASRCVPVVVAGDVVEQHEVAPLQQLGEFSGRHAQQRRRVAVQGDTRVVGAQHHRRQLHPRPVKRAKDSSTIW